MIVCELIKKNQKNQNNQRLGRSVVEGFLGVIVGIVEGGIGGRLRVAMFLNGGNEGLEGFAEKVDFMVIVHKGSLSVEGFSEEAKDNDGRVSIWRTKKPSDLRTRQG